MMRAATAARRVSFGVLAAAAAVGGYGLVSPDAVIRAAVDQQSRSAPISAGAFANAPEKSGDKGPRRSAAASKVGDEGYWLSRGEAGLSVPLGKAFTVGERITIAGAEGDRVLEIIEVTPIGSPLMTVSDGPNAVRLLMISMRVVGASPERHLRLYVEADASSAAATPDIARTSKKAL